MLQIELCTPGACDVSETLWAAIPAGTAGPGPDFRIFFDVLADLGHWECQHFAGEARFTPGGFEFEEISSFEVSPVRVNMLQNFETRGVFSGDD